MRGIAVLLFVCIGATAYGDDHRGHGLEILIEGHVEWRGHVIADPSGLGPGANVIVGKQNGWGGQLGWGYASRYRVDDDFGDSTEYRVHYVLAGLSRRWSIDRYSFAGVGFGGAFTRTREQLFPDFGNPHPVMTTHGPGGWADAKVGMDLFQLTGGHAVSVTVALGLMVANHSAFVASAGLAYHWR